MAAQWKEVAGGLGLRPRGCYFLARGGVPDARYPGTLRSAAEGSQ